MHNTIVKLKTGEAYSGPIWAFKPKEGWFSIISYDDEFPDGDERKFYFKDVESAITKGTRINNVTIDDRDELERFKNNTK